MTAGQIRVVQLKLKFYIFMHARCRFVRIFQLVIVLVFQMYSCMTIECIPSSSRVGRVHSSLLAKMMASVMAATAFSGRTALMQRTSPLESHMTPAMREDTASGRDADETKILRASAEILQWHS